MASSVKYVICHACTIHRCLHQCCVRPLPALVLLVCACQFACCSHTVNQVANEPRKYTPSQTWAAIHSQNGSAASPAPGSYTPRQATAYHPPPAAPGPPPAAAPSPATHNLRNFGQQMHSPQKYGYLFE